MNVAVVIPAFGRAELLKRALDSVFKQTLRPVEIIVVDDGSNPPISTLLDARYLRKATWIRNTQRRNAAFSRNSGFHQSEAPIVAFLDSDDIWFPNHLESAVLTLKGAEPLSLFVGDYQGCTVESVSDIFDAVFDSERDFRSSGLVCHRALFEAIEGFDPRLEKHQDWDFALRAFNKGRVILGARPTFAVDSEADGRMSHLPNVTASNHFLEKHGAQMSARQKSKFLARVVISSAQATDPAILQHAKSLTRKYISPYQLPLKALAFWHSPSLSRAILSMKRAVRRYATMNL